MHRTALVFFVLLGSLAAFRTATGQQPSPTPSATPAMVPASPAGAAAPSPPPDNNCGTCHRGHVNPAEGSGRPRPPR